MVRNFTVYGISIQQDDDINIKGTYVDNNTVHWYNGATYYGVWGRSNETCKEEESEQNLPEQTISTIGNPIYAIVVSVIKIVPFI